MPINWDKIKKQSTTKPIGILQKPEIQTKEGGIDWNKIVLKKGKKTQIAGASDIEAIRKIKGGELPLTKWGHIDTRYFDKTPKWVLKFNKAIDTKITKKFQKEPASLLMRVMDLFSRAHPYEAIRDIIVEPEKYPTILSKLGHYLKTVVSPEVSPALRGFSELTRGFTPEYKGLLSVFQTEEQERAEYERRVLGEGLPPTAFKVGDKVIDVGKAFGFFEDIVLDPTNWALMGLGKLARTPLIPITSKLKVSVTEAMLPVFKKNLVMDTIAELTQKSVKEGVGEAGTQVFKNIVKEVGEKNIDDAYTIFLDKYAKGWQNFLIPKGSTAIPKKLSVIDYFITRISKAPYEAKITKQLSRSFGRAFGQTLDSNFDSIMKSLNIADDSLEANTIAKYFDDAFQIEGLKKGSVKRVLMEKTFKDTIKDFTPQIKQGIDYWKKLNSMMEYIETSKPFDIMLDQGHIKNYLYDKFIHTGKKQAFSWVDLSKRIKAKHGVTRPVFTLKRQMNVQEAIAQGYEIASPFTRMKARLKLHAEAVNYRAFLGALDDMYGETSKKVAIQKGYRLVKMKDKRFVKPLLKTYFPDDIASYIEKGNEIIKLGDFQQKLLKVISPITRAYKTIWTFTSGFQIRNFIGSNYQNAIYFGAKKVLNPKTQKLISKLAWTTDDFDFVLNGQKVNSKLFRKMFNMSGVSAGWYKGEIGDLSKVLGVRSMKWAGEMVERDVRMFAFYSALNQGDDLIKSGLTTKLLHFDYIDGLSQFEKIYMRTGIPFYAWYRFNAPLQLRFMIENPYRVSNIFKVWRSLGIGTPEETPDWFDNYMMGRIGDLDVAKNIQKYFKIDLPISQIGLLQPSWEALMEDKDLTLSQRWLKLLSPFMNLTHPFIKTVWELTSNFDTFRERPVYKKVVSPVPTFIIDALPEFSKNWFEAELEVSKSGFRRYKVDGMKAKILENLIPLYQLNVLSGYAKYEGYKEQKSRLDVMSLTYGIKLYPVNLDYLQGKYKKSTKKVPSKKIDWNKVKKGGQ